MPASSTARATPGGGSAHLTAGRVALLDPVAETAHVVKQEVRIRLKRAEAKGRGIARAAGERANVAVGAPDLLELAAPNIGSAPAPTVGGRPLWPRAGRWGEKAHEIVEEVDILEIVVDARDWITGKQTAVTLRAVLVREQWRRDPHLIEIRVGRELEQIRYLALPTEPAHRRLPGDDVGDHARAPGRRRVRASLPVREREQGGIGNGVHESQAEQRGGAALGDDRRLRGDLLRDEVAGALDSDPVGLDQRTSEVGEWIEGAVRHRAEAGLHGLAAAAGRADVVAARARGAVEDGAQAAGHVLDLLEDRQPVAEAL